MAHLGYRRAAHVSAAITHLSASDPVIGQLIQSVGPFTLRLERDRFALLVRSILSQQISTKAARAIRLKLEAQTKGEGLTHAAIARLTVEQMRAAGLSGQKVTYLQDLAAHVADGRLELDRLHRLSDDEVIEQLVAVKGIGHWTAQMFLMFSLGRLDVFPHDDLGIRAAIRGLYQLQELPRKAESLTISAPWRPYATIASWYLWRWSDLKSDPSQDASRYPV